MTFKISYRMVGNEAPVYVVAEISANHRQDMDHAIKLWLRSLAPI